MSGQYKKLKSKRRHTMEKLSRRKALIGLAAAGAGAAMAGVAKAEGAEDTEDPISVPKGKAATRARAR